MKINKEKKVSFRKGVYILPNLLTTASLFTAFWGLILASDGKFDQSAVAILVSALLDGLDGKVARWTNTASEFGVQLDSLADLVAFGVAPAFMLYKWQLFSFGRLGLMACFLIAACGALRLARFNVQSSTASKKFFTGLPIPAAGCTLATLVLVHPLVPQYIDAILPTACLILAYGLSYLMVSRVRYASFKEYGLVKAHPFSSMVTAILLFALVASIPRILGCIIMLFYVISGPVYTFYFMPRRHRKLMREQGEQNNSGEAAKSTK